MKKKYTTLLLAALLSAAPVVVATPEGKPRGSKKHLRFERQENLKLMNMLRGALKTNQSRYVTMLVGALAVAHKAEELRKALADGRIDDETFDAAAKTLVSEMLTFFEFLSAVEDLVEESLEKSTLVNLKEHYTGRKPFLMFSVNKQQEALVKATREMRREIILEVAAVLEVLKYNMGEKIGKEISTMVEARLAAERQAAEGKASRSPEGGSTPEIEA